MAFLSSAVSVRIGTIHLLTAHYQYSHRKSMRGFVQTPDTLVDYMVNLLFEGRTIAPGERLLDPGCGTGAFMKGVIRWSVANQSRVPLMTGIEIDNRMAADASSQLRSIPYVRVVEGDFLNVGGTEKYHYIIGNPPLRFDPAFERTREGQVQNSIPCRNRPLRSLYAVF